MSICEKSKNYKECFERSLHLKRLQLRSCRTFTRRQMRALSPFLAFSTSAPRSTRSTIAFYSIDSSTTTVSADWSFSGLSLIQSIRAVQRGHLRDYQSPPVCHRGPSWGRSSSYPTRPKSSPSFSTRASKCTRSADYLQIYGSTAQNGAADLMARMSFCIECVASWMSSNRLRLNPSKTELIWLGTSRRLLHCEGFNMTVCGADVRQSSVFEILVS